MTIEAPRGAAVAKHRPLAPPAPTANHRLEQAADRFKWGMVTNAVVQDTTRTTTLVTRLAGLRVPRAMNHVTEFTNGEKVAVFPAFRWLGDASSKGILAVAPKATRLAGATAGFLRGAGGAFMVLSKYCQIITLPFAVVDTMAAIREQDPEAKKAKTLNAAITTFSGITGVIGIFWYASPIGLPSLVLSIGCGLFQLLDHSLWKDEKTHWWGQRLIPDWMVGKKPRASA